MKKSLFFFFAFALTVLAFNACKKSDDTANDRDVAISEDLAVQEDFSAQLDADIDQGIEERGGGGACPVVTLAQPWGTWPNTITIDYGTGCSRPDGRVLKGKIIVNQTGELRTAGAVRTVTHDNFFIDDVQLEGTRTWTNNGTSAGGQFSYTRTATGMKLTYSDGTFATWEHQHTVTWIEGRDTPTWLDDVWSTTGSTTGVGRNGATYSSTITEPLIKRNSCRWISEGVITITRDGNTSTLDFGDGTCDRFATVTRPNGETFSIRLRR